MPAEDFVIVRRADLRTVLDGTREWWEDLEAQGEEEGAAARRLQDAVGGR